MECQEIPPFPAGNRFVETIEHGSERVHPGICPLNAISERQEFSVQKIFLIVFGMIVEIYISNDSGTVTFSSEIVTVKSGGKTGADWDSAPEQTGTLLMLQS